MDDRSAKGSLSGFAFYLSQANILEKETAQNALTDANKAKIPYIEYLIKRHILESSQLAHAVSEYFGLPLCNIKSFNFENLPSEYFNIPIVRKRAALPLFIKQNILYLAVTDPTLENLDDVRFLTGKTLRYIIVESKYLTETIDNLLNSIIVSEIGDIDIQETENISINAAIEDDEMIAYDAESAPVVNYVNKIILDAVEKGASDIHFERYSNDYRVRYRINGVLYPAVTPPTKIANFLLARIKIMSNLDITEHRVPQDGRFKLTLSKNKLVDFRVSVCPTLYGEKIVLRLLDPTQIYHALDDLGMEPFQKSHLLHALGHTQGIILVTGPTGSGKTVTLYSCLSYLNSNEDNIMTVEDPVEIPLHGINQVHVNPKVGLTFSAALRSFLRQDPDIIMVGEIRDLETAEISVKAAQTGHLVLSTLHTNSGPETISRLMNMGVEPYNVASSMVLVLAQRLLRTLCNRCKQKENLPDDILLKEGFNKEELGTFQLYKAGNCNHCMHGYTGRTAIFEIMPVTDEMKNLIMRNANAIELQAQAKKEGIITLRDSGLAKVKQGITSLMELNRTFK